MSWKAALRAIALGVIVTVIFMWCGFDDRRAECIGAAAAVLVLLR